MSAEQIDPVEPTTVRTSTSMRRANGRLRSRSAVLDEAGQIPFFCECRDAACYRAVWLSYAAFDALAADDSGWVLAPGHVPSAFWRVHASAPQRFPVRRADAAPGPRSLARLRLRPVPPGTETAGRRVTVEGANR